MTPLFTTVMTRLSLLRSSPTRALIGCDARHCGGRGGVSACGSLISRHTSGQRIARRCSGATPARRWKLRASSRYPFQRPARLGCRNASTGTWSGNGTFAPRLSCRTKQNCYYAVRYKVAKQAPIASCSKHAGMSIFMLIAVLRKPLE